MSHGSNKPLFIHINPTNLQTSVTPKKPRSGMIISATPDENEIQKRTALSLWVNPLFDLVYGEVLHPLREREDHAKGVLGRRYLLSPPDPWLLAVAAIMWEGLLQGSTWETVKVAVLRALSVLREYDLAPHKPGSRKARTEKKRHTRSSKVALGFSWTQFGHDGKELHTLFIGLKRAFNEKTENQKRLVTRGAGRDAAKLRPLPKLWQELLRGKRPRR